MSVSRVSPRVLLRTPRAIALAACLLGAAVLGGCDMLGIESGTDVAARKEAEGKAIGSACRQALRAIEDCYTLNPKASKAAVFAGWREMDEYMRENKLEGIVPVIPRKVPGAPPPADAQASAAADDEPEKPARKPKAKAEH
jgi:hypothetical protein